MNQICAGLFLVLLALERTRRLLISHSTTKLLKLDYSRFSTTVNYRKSVNGSKNILQSSNRYRRGNGFESSTSLNFVQALISHLLKLCAQLRWSVISSYLSYIHLQSSMFFFVLFYLFVFGRTKFWEPETSTANSVPVIVPHWSENSQGNDVGAHNC